jgi:hypothetical protein
MQIEQITMFDTMQDPAEDWFTRSFREQIRKGNGFSGSKIRIYAAAILKDRDRLADFLQQEYYVGGHSIPDGFMDYDSRGIVIRHWETHEKRKWPWHRVRDEVLRQIRTGEYLTAEEYERFQQICAANGGNIPQPRSRMKYE